MRWLLLPLVLLGAATAADARFAESSGFSGKHGSTCLSCHSTDPLPVPEADVVVDNVPSAWDADGSYTLHIRILGGPPAARLPRVPQGGFDLETDLGVFAAPASESQRLRFPSPTEATYTPEGTLTREWNVTWTLPSSPTPPHDAHLWVAGLSANGNHVMDGPDTAGERGDRAANRTYTVPASIAARDAWTSQPLAPPRLSAYEPPARPAPSVLSGTVPDFADGAEVRIDANGWEPAIGAPSFFFQLAPWAPGAHTIDARTIWQDRTSEPVRLHIGTSASPASVAAPARIPYGLIAWLGLLGVLLVPLALKLRR